MRRLTFVVLLALAWLTSSAHVGSPEVWYDGPAGPYSIRVLIRPPRVVPGLADIAVRVRGGAERVSVAPARFDTGIEGTPAPDVATPVRGDPESFSAQLWIMARGAYRIVVNVTGEHGSGSTVVPITATATERLPMPRLLGIVLLGVLGFLLAGLVGIVGAAVRESVLPPGQEPTPQRQRHARLATAGATLLFALLLLGGWNWWSAVDNWHRNRLDRPWESQANTYLTASGSQALTLAITDSLWLQRRNEAWLRRQNRFARASLIPDHGKLMHMFLVRSDDLAGFAHLHPATSDSIHFHVQLPELPAGAYTVYADIVEESGATHTLVTETRLPAQTHADSTALHHAPERDADDAGWSGPPLGSLNDSIAVITPDMVLRLRTRAPLLVGRETELRVSLSDSTGRSLAIEPYMGMPAHMMLRHADGSVFVHLHPLGTISLAAQMQLAAALDHAAHASMNMSAQGEGAIVFPYAFPIAGQYRVWVQVQHGGAIRTGAFDLSVQPDR